MAAVSRSRACSKRWWAPRACCRHGGIAALDAMLACYGKLHRGKQAIDLDDCPALIRATAPPAH